MNDPTRGPTNAHSETFDPIPYLRGLRQVIDAHRLEYILTHTNRRRRRQRRWLGSAVVWLVIAMSLFATHSIPKVWRCLHPHSDRPEPCDSAFTKARRRLGVAVFRALFQEFARPMAAPATPGAFDRGGRLMGIDGTTFDIPDTPENEKIFGRGGKQRCRNAFPQVRVLARCELGTHAIRDFAWRPLHVGEPRMVPSLLRSLHPGMLLLWDRGFFGFDLVNSVLQRGCHRLARVKTSQLALQRLRTLPDGS